MNWMTGFGYTPNKNVPATVISSTTFTPIGNDTRPSTRTPAAPAGGNAPRTRPAPPRGGPPHEHPHDPWREEEPPNPVFAPNSTRDPQRGKFPPRLEEENLAKKARRNRQPEQR